MVLLGIIDKALRIRVPPAVPHTALSLNQDTGRFARKFGTPAASLIKAELTHQFNAAESIPEGSKARFKS